MIYRGSFYNFSSFIPIVYPNPFAAIYQRSLAYFIRFRFRFITGASPVLLQLSLFYKFPFNICHLESRLSTVLLWRTSSNLSRMFFARLFERDVKQAIKRRRNVRIKVESRIGIQSFQRKQLNGDTISFSFLLPCVSRVFIRCCIV